MCAISIYMIFLHENIINFEKKKKQIKTYVFDYTSNEKFRQIYFHTNFISVLF